MVSGKAKRELPNANKYNEALQNPRSAFRNPELQGCKPETNTLGVPKARSGNFAIVYKMMEGSNPKKALRVFKAPQEEHQKRYDIVSRHLDALRAKKPSCIIGFKYDLQGIKVDNDWFPTLVMDWVRGVSLSEWVRLTVEANAPGKLRALSEEWGKLIADLRNANISHGDLQHGNVMVQDDRPVLVDYDCMCVPNLVGQRALEAGMDAYQHPLRREQKFLSLDFDHFSAWVILIVLRALSIDLSLYKRYVVDRKNDNILFIKEDMTEPGQSPLWKELLAFGDPDVRSWSRTLYDTLPNKPWTQIPVFTLDPFAKLRTLCTTRPVAWVEVCAEGDRLTGQTPPPELAKTVEEGRKRLACRNAVQKAVQDRRLRRIDQEYNPTFLDDWPDCVSLVQVCRQARGLRPTLDQLEAAAKNPGNGRALVDLWQKHGPALRSFVEADSVGTEADRWSKRLTALKQLVDEVQKRPASESMIVAAWDRLRDLGGHSEATPHEDRVKQARIRAELLGKLNAIPTVFLEDHDQRFLATWNDAVLQGCDEANPLRGRVDEARKRLALLTSLRTAIDQANRNQGAEQSVLDAAQRLPQGYCPALKSRLEEAQKRIEKEKRQRQAREQLARVLQAVPLSDRALANAFEEAKATGVNPAPADLPQCQQAVKRREALRLLDGINGRLPENEQDEEWDKRWNAPLLQGCADADLLRPRYEKAVERLRQFRLLEDAIRRADAGQTEEQTILDAAVYPLGRPYCPGIWPRVETAQKRLEASRTLRTALTSQPLSDIRIAEAYSQAQAVGVRLPSAEQSRCETALKRRDCLRKLSGIGTSRSEEDQDTQWKALWNASLLQGCSDADPHRPRYQKAEERLNQLALLRSAVQAGDDRRILSCAVAPLTKDYCPSLWAEREKAKDRVETRSDLEQALRTYPVSDLRLATIAERARKVGLKFSMAEETRLQQACQRQGCLQGLQAISPLLPADEQDALWLQNWNGPLLDGCTDADPLRGRYGQAEERVKAWRVLAQVLDARDVTQIHEASDHSLLRDYPPRLRREAEIKALKRDAGLLRDVLEVVQRADPRQFFTPEQIAYIRENQDKFSHYAPQIEPFVQSWIQNVKLNKADPDHYRDPNTGKTMVLWNWPERGRITHCDVAICNRAFYPTPDSVPGGTRHWSQQDHGNCGGGIGVTPLPGRSTVYVTVWPVVDLGWVRIPGQPLRIGPVNLAKRP